VLDEEPGDDGGSGRRQVVPPDGQPCRADRRRHAGEDQCVEGEDREPAVADAGEADDGRREVAVADAPAAPWPGSPA
jgi:hypothetical protein